MWGFDWAGAWFDVNTDEVGTFKGNLFYVLTIFVVVLCIQLVCALIVGFDEIPGLIAFPDFEVDLFLGMSIGTLDVAAAVLMNPVSAPGWKAMAVLEIFVSFSVILWFLWCQREFKRKTEWVPYCNIPQHKFIFDLDANEDGHISKKDLRKAHKIIGITLDQVDEIFEKLYTDDNQLQRLTSAEVW